MSIDFMLRTLFFFFVIASFYKLEAQQFNNIRAKMESGKVAISYDFVGPSEEKLYDIRLECSTDGGTSFSFFPKLINGDVAGISSGKGKKIIWDVSNETTKIALNQLTFQLAAIENSLSKAKPDNSISASVPNNMQAATEEGTFTDPRDGHVYQWVKIGSQIWMAENLAYLPSISPAKEGSQTKPYFYVFGYNGANIDEAKSSGAYILYGVLYNWEASRNACPAGWHIPSEAEWQQLEKELGMSEVQAKANGLRGSIAGMKMKSAEGWNKMGNGSNTSGLTALPGGGRYGDGSFGNAGSNGFWWSSSEYETNFSWGRGLTFDSQEVYKGVNYKDNGYSIRCIRDK